MLLRLGFIMVIIKLLQISHSIITSTGGTAFPVQAELDTLKGVYALYDALDYLQVMVIAIPTSKKTAPWQA